jgi:jumonji domain-containing protein 2
MRHRAEFFFPEKLEKMGIPYRIVDQRPGETIVILPDAYHQGFSTGYTLAEAKNYAEMSWSTNRYQACSASCKLMTAIPEAFMAPLKEGQTRLDLCANYSTACAPPPPPKRDLEEASAEAPAPEQENVKRVKLE